MGKVELILGKAGRRERDGAGIWWPFWRVKPCNKKYALRKKERKNWKIPICLSTFFERLLSIKMFVFFVFVVLRCFNLAESGELVSLGFFVIGANSGMKIYHGVMERERDGRD